MPHPEPMRESGPIRDAGTWPGAGRGPGADPIRRRTALALPAALAAAMLAPGCATRATVPPPAGADPLPVPALRVGDRWRYRLIDMYSRGTIGETTVQVAAAGTDLRLTVDAGRGEATLEERYTDPWTVLVDVTYGDPIVFESPVPVVPAGTRVGAWQRTSTRYRTERSSRALAWQQSLRVVGWERVDVPAGAFDALRIERVIHFQHPDVFRFSPDRSDVLWYSPQVGRWVARQWTGTYMPGSPSGRAGRAREEWVRWELTGWQAAG
jgi:hypothetical protein